MNWLQLLDDHRIHYVTSGPNTKRGEISIQCPFCGADDPSQHMGINLEAEAWGCHRNQAHRGKKPHRLIRAILGCSSTQVDLIIKQYGAADPDTLESAILALTGENEPPVKPAGALKLPPEAQPIPHQGRFYDYIRSRGFDKAGPFAAYYNLKCATTGRWKDRIIIPVMNETGSLLAWTARAIMRPVSAPRYLSSSNEIKETIYNLPNLLGGEILFVTEGPFDALKVDWYGWPEEEANATAVFGTSITMSQISLLKNISKQYKRVVILLDPDAVESSFHLSEWLPTAVMGQLPLSVKDPGDLNKQQVKDLVKQYKNN